MSETPDPLTAEAEAALRDLIAEKAVAGGTIAAKNAARLLATLDAGRAELDACYEARLAAARPSPAEPPAGAERRYCKFCGAYLHRAEDRWQADDGTFRCGDADYGKLPHEHKPAANLPLRREHSQARAALRDSAALAAEDREPPRAIAAEYARLATVRATTPPEPEDGGT